MERSRRRLPSPALLISCLALFVALGGTVLAATKIDGRTIKVKSLPGNRVKVGSLPGNRVAPGSLKGDRIDARTLAQVPSADHADSATEARHAQTAIAADHATDASTINGRAVGCGGGQRQFAGACWDVAARENSLTAAEAAIVCGTAGGELPDALAFQAFSHQPGIVIAVDGEWSKDIGQTGSKGLLTMAYLTAAGLIEGASGTLQKQFRCVTPLLH